MLEYFAFKRYKQHKAKLAEEPALSRPDTEFLQQSLIDELPALTSDEANRGQDKKWYNVNFPSNFPSFPLHRASNHHTAKHGSHEKGKGKGKGKEKAPDTDEEGTDGETETPGDSDPAKQTSRISQIFAPFDLDLNITGNSTLIATTFSHKTKALLHEFTQILKDIQAGVPHAKTDLEKFLNAHSSDLKAAEASLPGFVKVILMKLLPLGSIPMSIEELGSPGAIMGLFKKVMVSLRTWFPAFVGSQVLSVLGLVVLMVCVWYCYKRGREERLLGDTDGPLDSHQVNATQTVPSELSQSDPTNAPFSSTPSNESKQHNL